MGSVGGEGPEVREVLPLLLRTVSGHQVQHHHPAKDAVLHDQPHSAVRRHLFGDSSAVLHAGQLRREDHDGYDDPYFSQHLPAAGRRDQPVHLAGNAVDRQVSPVHHDPRRRVNSHDRSRSQPSHARCKLARDVAVGQGRVPQSSSSSALHATTAGRH